MLTVAASSSFSRQLLKDEFEILLDAVSGKCPTTLTIFKENRMQQGMGTPRVASRRN